MKKDVIYHTFNGKRYKIQFLPESCFDGKTDGMVDPPDKKNKTMKIRKNMTDEDILETLIHEAAHILLWNHEEQFIEQMARDLSRFLTRLGYRRLDR